MTDPIADLLTRIRNASRAGHPTVVVPDSKVKRSLLDVLKKEGYVDRVDSFKDANNHPWVKIFLRYSHQGRPVIKEITRLSRSGKRVYVGKDQIPKFRSGLGVYIVSTSKGMLTDTEARQGGIGGELICSVF